jgi:hypothetical protein
MDARHITDITNAASAARFRRPECVVWRLASDRVLVRRIGDLTDDGCADLIGFAAAVWVALDEPASLPELSARLADAGIDTAAVDDVDDSNHVNHVDALAALVERRWIEQIDAQPDRQADANEVDQPDPADDDHER